MGSKGQTSAQKSGRGLKTAGMAEHARGTEKVLDMTVGTFYYTRVFVRCFGLQVEKPRKLLYGASAVFVYRGTAPRVQMEGG